MSVPAFIDCEWPALIAEIREYLVSEGADLKDVDPESAGMAPDLNEIIKAFKQHCEKKENTPDNAADIEQICNSMVMFLQMINFDQAKDLIVTFSKVMTEVEPAEKFSAARVKVMMNLFMGLEENCNLRASLYKDLVHLAGKTKQIHLINPDLEQIKKWTYKWGMSLEDIQDLLRTLHAGLVQCKKSELATKVMIELLGTYTEETAAKAKEDAQRCIVTYIADPKSYILSHLLTLKPVKILEGEIIHELLLIFVTGTLAQYVTFHEVHKDWVKSIGLSHEDNMHKMRLLSFMQMSENNKQVDYATMQRELLLKSDEIEQFIIDVLKSDCGMRVKIDDNAKCVTITSTALRTFGDKQWILLRDRLDQWQDNLNTVISSLQTVLHSNPVG